jgi:hypothetical protein
LINGAAAAVGEDDGVASITEPDCSAHGNLRDVRLVEQHRLANAARDRRSMGPSHQRRSRSRPPSLTELSEERHVLVVDEEAVLDVRNFDIAMRQEKFASARGDVYHPSVGSGAAGVGAVRRAR